MKNIVITILIGVLLLSIFSFQFFVKIRVECVSQYGKCPSDIDSLLKQGSGKNIFLAKNKIKQSASANLQISDYSIHYKLPNVLLVNIIIKKPVYSIFNISNSNALLANENGQILSSGGSVALPEIRVQQTQHTVGSTIGNTELFALKIQRGVHDMYQVRSGELAEDRLTVVLPSQIRVIFPLQGDVDLLLGSLRLVYSKIESSGDLTKFSEIDLRFKNPVLR